MFFVVKYVFQLYIKYLISTIAFNEFLVDIEVLSVEEYGAEENFDVQNVMEIPVEEQALPGLLNGNDPINEENQNNYQQERNEEFYDAENGPPIPRFIRFRDHLFNFIHWRCHQFGRG